MTPRTEPQRFSVHGIAPEIDCQVPALEPELTRLLGGFRVASFAQRCQPTFGSIRPYSKPDVLRHLSSSARRVTLAHDQSGELYEDGERFWLIDDRWGMVEINLLKSQWRAWLLPHARVDAVRRAEAAMMWPMAQLLRAKGLYLLPAASVVRNGFGLLLLSPLEMAPELMVLVRAGCRVIGQRWTALREQDGKLEMLHLPGLVDRSATPYMRLASPGQDAPTAWCDLAHDHYGCELSRGACDAVFVIARGRRPQARLRALRENAAEAIRAGWPIEELHPLRRHGQLPAKLAAKCAAYEVELSRDPHDLLRLMNALPQRGTGISVSINRAVVPPARRAVAV